MQNTYQEKSLDPIDKDFLFGKKLEGGIKLSTVSDFKPAGDQPEAIKKLISGIKDKKNDQVLLGVTGSGKTFSMAKIIEALNRPALILAPNKTLAAQLYGEMKTFFPNNAVEYFVSYYDYYTPEAYVPRSDTYIEKEASINEQIDRMRHSATRSLLERDDVIIVASVSCIYGLGSVESYSKMTLGIKKNHEQAIQVFENFTERFPNDLDSDNAFFWIGRSHLELNQVEKAEGAFRKVLTLYEHRPTTQGYKTPDSIYMLGKLNQHKNLNQRASYYYKEVIKRFPGSAAARNAERDLGSITQ